MTITVLAPRVLSAQRIEDIFGTVGSGVAVAHINGLVLLG